MNPDTVKSNFDNKLWTAVMVRIAVQKGVITSAQYTEITGQAY